jgi:hypothetical protein
MCQIYRSDNFKMIQKIKIVFELNCQINILESLNGLELHFN